MLTSMAVSVFLIVFLCGFMMAFEGAREVVEPYVFPNRVTSATLALMGITIDAIMITSVFACLITPAAVG